MDNVKLVIVKMKNICISLLLLFMLPLQGMAADGVVFRNLKFADALKAAKAEKKKVFLDCYTSWCVPSQPDARHRVRRKRHLAVLHFKRRFHRHNAVLRTDVVVIVGRSAGEDCGLVGRARRARRNHRKPMQRLMTS